MRHRNNSNGLRKRQKERDIVKQNYSYLRKNDNFNWNFEKLTCQYFKTYPWTLDLWIYTRYIENPKGWWIKKYESTQINKEVKMERAAIIQRTQYKENIDYIWKHSAEP